MQLQLCHLEIGVAFYGWFAADQFTLEDLLLINYEGKKILCLPKLSTLLPWGRQKNLVTFTLMDGMLCIFPKMFNYNCVRTPPFCGLEGTLQINFVPQVSRDSIAIFSLEYIFWRIRILLQLMFFLQLLFSFIAVVQKRIIPRKVSWRVKSENTFTPADSTFLTEVAFTCTATAKNKI